jgi:hypothetical protein
VDTREFSGVTREQLEGIQDFLAANLSYEEYVDAADELVVGGSQRARRTRVTFRFLGPRQKGGGGSEKSSD